MSFHLWMARRREAEIKRERDSDGTATAALCEDIAVPQDCQARAVRHRPDTPSLQTPQGGDS